MFGKKQEAAPDSGMVNLNIGGAANSTAASEANAKIMAKMTYSDEEIIKLLSQLTDKKRVACSICLVKAEHFDNNIERDFINQYLRVGVSIDRKGRKEMVDMVTNTKAPEARRGFFSRLRGSN